MKIKEVQEIIKDFESSSLMTMELEMEGFKIKLSKNKFEEKVTIKEKELKQNQLLETIDIKDQKKKIKSPLVGTFFIAATPNSQPFIEVGQRIKKGQVVCIIEAMKIMNEIKSPFDGVIEEIMISNGSAVGFDQTIIRLGDIDEK